MIEKKEKQILIFGKIMIRKEIGINIPVEEQAEHEFE